MINGRRTILAAALTLWAGLATAQQAVPSVPVTFEFGGRDPVTVSVTYEEVVELIHEKHPYMIQFWVAGALAKAVLKYSIERQQGHNRISEIAGVREDAHGEWVYYVNGIRSIYHINTQSADGLRSIRFVFKPRQIKG